jgi:hypothetical protein
VAQAPGTDGREVPMKRRRGPWAYRRQIIRFPYRRNLGPDEWLEFRKRGDFLP